ncbi:MAG: hypothetical protein N3F67_01675 [Acidilobaceae archaeon]|nr:hypothetical protein [Acidilobaceae archaeon]
MDKKQFILKAIEDNRSPWVKAAFYSDPDVSRILEELTKRWEREGRGIPLDYATEEELEELYRKAASYAFMSEEEARGRVWGEKSGGLLGLLRRLLGR